MASACGQYLTLRDRAFKSRVPYHFLHVLEGGVEETQLFVERAHLLHLAVGEGEVEDVDILPDVVGIGGSGYHRESLLYVPAQDDLGGSLAVCLGYPHDDRVSEQGPFGHRAANREPAFHLDALGCGLLAHLYALGVWMALDLEHCGLDDGAVHDGVPHLVIGVEVADVEGAYLAHSHSLLHVLPRTGEVTDRLMDVEQVDVLQLHPLQYRVYRRESLALTVFRRPELAGDPYLLAGYAAFLHGLAHTLLVVVGVRRVDVAVAGFQSRKA